MPAILMTFTAVAIIAMVIHRVLGRPDCDLIAILKVCGWLTIAFVALSQGSHTIAATATLLESLLQGGPSG